MHPTARLRHVATTSLLVLLLLGGAATARAAETLSLVFTPANPGGGSQTYVAVWLTLGGTYTNGMTMGYYGNYTANYYNEMTNFWNAVNGKGHTKPNGTDAKMGSTLGSVSQVTMNNIDVSSLPDGTYTINFGIARKNNMTAYTSYAFTKNGTASSLPAPVSQSGWTLSTITYSGRSVLPGITTQPANTTVSAGANATFTIVATGATSYQWLRGGTAIAGATTASYTLTGAQISDSGAVFACQAINASGTTSSGNATLTVNALAPQISVQPSPQSVATAATASFSVTATSTVAMTYQWQVSTAGTGGPWSNVSGGTGATTASYTIAATVIGDNGRNFHCVVTNSTNGNLATTSNAALLTVSNVVTPPAITTQPANLARLDGQGAAFTVAASGSPLYYQWKRNGAAIAGATTASYSFTCTIANNGDQFTCTVSNAAGANAVTTTAAILTVTASPPAIATSPPDRTVGAGASTTFTVTASGTAPLAYQWTRTDAGGTTNVGTNTTSYTFSTVAADDGARFACIVSNAAGIATSASAVLHVVAPPQITTQPAAAAVTAGTTVDFLVAATGTSLTYQWKRNGASIAGATSTLYTITPTAANDGDVFTCAVTNLGGTTLSSPATLTIVQLPQVTTQPVGLTVDSGTAVSFTITASGTGPLAYLWQHDATDIPGATAATYTIPAATLADVGNYTCTVSNTYGSDLSAPAALLVNAPAASFTLTFKTTAPGGAYAPKNIVAVWVEKPDGTFLKTLGNWSADRRASLTAWTAKAGAGDVDAVMGATRNDHAAPLTVTWDLIPRGGGAPIGDGDYVVRFEVVDDNGGVSAVRTTTTFTVNGGGIAPLGPLSLNGVDQVTINNQNAKDAPLEEPGRCGLGSAHALLGLLGAFMLLALRQRRMR